MFNDDVSMGFFDIYDQYLLNILYDPRIKAGMTVDEVRAVTPGNSTGCSGMGREDQSPPAAIDL